MTLDNAKNSKKNTNKPVIPATAIALTGQHLIEASAGTGKTWTLTGVVLRLLIEGRRAPEQIICTTFTRAAAAEMRERILGRLQEFYHLVLWLEKLSQRTDYHSWLYDLANTHNNDDINIDNHVDSHIHNDNDHNNTDSDNDAVLAEQAASSASKKKQNQQAKLEQVAQFRQQREAHILAFAKASGYETAEDPVNLHLLHYLLDNYEDYSLSMAIRRMQLLLISMDKLFVSTLDSLAQKWLNEYSTETGQQKGITISSDNEQDGIITDIIHDEIRRFHAYTKHSNPLLYQLLQQTGKLTQVADHKDAVKKALQFYTAPVNQLIDQSFDSKTITSYQTLLAKFTTHDYSDVQPYFDKDYRKEKGMSGNATLCNQIHRIPDIIKKIIIHGTGVSYHLISNELNFINSLANARLTKDEGGKGFNKDGEHNRAELMNLPTMQMLYELAEMISAIETLVDDSQNQLNYHIIQTVRTRLPVQLEERNATTFNLQMVKLNTALQGEQGQKLARYIRYHYPVALIDESQDINGEQATMIRAIYMNDAKEQAAATAQTTKQQTDSEDKIDKKDNGFLLLVGDPKQAIYGFRGGDVANYNAMKQLMKHRGVKPLSLTINRRSHSGITEALNTWFGVADKDLVQLASTDGDSDANDNDNAEANKFSELGESIHYQHIQAFKQHTDLSWLQTKPSKDANQAVINDAVNPANRHENSHEHSHEKTDASSDTSIDTSIDTSLDLSIDPNIYTMAYKNIDENIATSVKVTNQPNELKSTSKIPSITGTQPVSIIHLPYRYGDDKASKTTAKSKKTSKRKKDTKKDTENRAIDDLQIAKSIEAKQAESIKINDDLDPADMYQTLAIHIAQLLNKQPSAHTSQHLLAGRPIKASDIAVLAREKKHLQQLQWQLEKLGIDTVKTAEVNIFDTKMADDLLAILHAVKNPFHAGYVNRALTSVCYGLTLQQVKELEANQGAGQSSLATEYTDNPIYKNNQQTYGYHDFQARLKQAQQRWLEYGVMSAVQYLLTENIFANHNTATSSDDSKTTTQQKYKKISVWEQIASHKEGERYLLDLRQLLELLASFSRNKSSVEILDWFARQKNKTPNEENTQHPMPTESGVQLMTIHKSKGLEFPIVYILGMDSSAKNKSKGKNKELQLYPYIYYYHGNQATATNVTNNFSSNVTGNATDSSNPLMLKMQRRLSAVKADDQLNYEDIVNNDRLAEAKRLAYVALTRASEQVYIVLKDQYSTSGLSYSPANIWLECTSNKDYSLSPRLDSSIGWIEAHDIMLQASINTQSSEQSVSSTVSSSATSALATAKNAHNANADNLKAINYPNYTDVVRQTYFVGWSKTSFTALSRQLDKADEQVANSEADYLLENSLDNGLIATDYAVTSSLPDAKKAKSSIQGTADNSPPELPVSLLLDNIRFSFIRGAGAGTFLHQVLEKIDFNDSSNWSEEIDRGLREYNLPITYASAQLLDRLGQNSAVNQNTVNQDLANDQSTEKSTDQSKQTPHDELKNWLNDILHTPMLASAQCLADIPAHKRKPELGFDMGLDERFRAEQINAVFAKHLDIEFTDCNDTDDLNTAQNNATGADKDKLVTLSAKTTPHYYRYLRGEIDLVYEHAGKYYVVDYKSNYLGDSLQDYGEAQLNQAMSKAGYWLQAVIYQVALHRLLKLRLADYDGNEAQYLGAVEYVFVRGCVGDALSQHTDHTNHTNDEYGRVIWDIPVDLVKDMDALFSGSLNNKCDDPHTLISL